MTEKTCSTKDDLDFIISNLFSKDNETLTERTSSSKRADSFIDENIQARVLPISIRKRVLYNMSVGIY